MTALATTADLTARIGTLTAAQDARAAALLTDASELVRAYTGQTISEVVDDTATLYVSSGAVIRLPQRPVTAVTSVKLVDGTNRVTITDWAWDGLETVDLGLARIYQAADLVGAYYPVPRYNGATFEVVYTHGYAAGSIPGVIVAVVAGMVNRTLTAPSLNDLVTGETIGQYSYQVQQGSGGVGTSVRLMPSDMAVLTQAGYRRSSGSVTLRAR